MGKGPGRGESRKEPAPLAHLKELIRLLILQEEVRTDTENQRESLTGGMRQEEQEEMLLSLLEQGRILELLEDRKEKSWLEQAREAVFGLTPKEWQAFKEELLKESGLLPEKAGRRDDGSPVSGWLPEPKRGADAEKEMILETVSKVQRFFGESMDEPSGAETRDTRVGDEQPEPEILDAPVEKRLWEEIRRLRNRLTAEPSVSGELAELLNEGIRRLKRMEKLENGYRAVMEAVSYLDVSQWGQLKEDLFSAELQEDERFPGTVFHWLREERQNEEEEAGKERESNTRDGMTGEKRRFLKALMAEAENKSIPIRQKEQIFGRIFTKSRVLSEYIDWDEGTFQAGAWLSESPDTFQAPDWKGQELSAALSSLTQEEWKRLIKELPVIERERLQTIEEGKEAVQILWELFRDFPENQNREAELHHQKQRVLRFLNQSGAGREALGELLGEELREMEISGKRRTLYQSLTEAASCMTREEWKTFQREVTEALREETGEMDTIGRGTLNLRWLSGPEAENTEGGGHRKPQDGNVSGGQAVFGEETVSTGDELRELMEMSEEKQEFLKFLAGRFFSEKMPGTEERPEKNQGEEYGHWERVFKKSQVLSRYVSWEEARTLDGKSGIDLVKDGISRLDAKHWEVFRSRMEKRLFSGGFRREMYGALTLRRELGYAVRPDMAGVMKTGRFREFADGFREAVEEIFSVPSSLPPTAGETLGRLSPPGAEWILGKERGTAAAVRILENLRRTRVTEKEKEPEFWAYGTASLVITQSGAASDNRRLPPETVRPEIKSEVTRQVQEQTADIRFISRTQASGQEITAEGQADLKSLIRQVEQQQKELEELQKKQETAMQKTQLSQISKSVMKQLQGQLQMEGLRHGR